MVINFTVFFIRVKYSIGEHVSTFWKILKSYFFPWEVTKMKKGLELLESLPESLFMAVKIVSFDQAKNLALLSHPLLLKAVVVHFPLTQSKEASSTFCNPVVKKLPK